MENPNPLPFTKSSDLAAMVDLRGFEPLTSTLPVWRAPNCAKGPYSEQGIVYHKDSLMARGKTNFFHDQLKVAKYCFAHRAKGGWLDAAMHLRAVYGRLWSF